MVIGAPFVAALLFWPAQPAVHPSHTSTAEVIQEGAGTVSIALRLFADDIGAATGAAPGSPGAVAAIREYLQDRFLLADPRGRPIELQWRGIELVGEVLTVRLRATAAGGLSGTRVTNRVLTERFADQVNIVRATYGRRTATLIFVRGDGPKALP